MAAVIPCVNKTIRVVPGRSVTAPGAIPMFELKRKEPKFEKTDFIFCRAAAVDRPADGGGG